MEVIKMSEELNKEQLVRDFLHEVKKKLPGWLKDNKKELKDVLSELESHIWEKSEEIAAEQDVQIYHVQQALQAMGNPRDIAQEYKKRGTPKVWISEELFPSYLKVFGIIVCIIIGVNLISFIVDVIENGFINNQFLSYLEITFSSALGTFLVVTVIFVALSVEGYLPEDFEKSKYKRIIESTPQAKRQRRTQKIRPPLKRGELLAGGIIGLLVGIAMFAEVWVYIPLVENIGSSLTYYIRVAGLFAIVGGVINLIQAMIDLTNYFAQRALIALNTIKDLAFIPFTLTLLVPAVLSVPAIDALRLTNLGLYDSIRIGITVVKWISVVGAIIGAISNTYKIITLRMKFEEYLRYQEM